MGSKIIRLTKTSLEHRYLPAVLAVIAVIIMLPSLKIGLFMDDYVQWATLAKPSQLPQKLYETGHVPDNPGTLSTALFNQFGFNRNSQNMKQYRDYGLLPWWTHENFKASLWRPLTALTHWIDYRMFPDSPALMHTHNIIWFAAVIFFLAILYRKLLPAAWVAGLAAVFFLLDENSYFPVMFIASRGYFLAIFFAILTLLAHHRWRTTNSRSAAIGAQLFLLLSILSNEAGVTTFAYLLAYAIALDRVNWRQRALTLTPAMLVIILWRVVYNSLGYGVYGAGLYIDPLNDPTGYILALFQRVPIILMGQLTWQSCDLFHFLSDSIRIKLVLFSLAFLTVVFFTLIPLLRKNRVARFWFIAMIISVFPVATVAPMSKNLPFVAFAAFGLIAFFVGGFLAKESWLPKSRIWQVTAWAVCIIFMIVHLPMAAAARIIASQMTGFVVNAMRPAIDIGSSAELGNQDLVLVNTPSRLMLTAMPFFRAYKSQPLPRTIRTLAPGFRAVEIIRIDDRTLVLKTKSGNIFSCEQSSPLHFVYFFETPNVFRAGRLPFNVGDKVTLSRLTVEVISVDDESLPNEISFTFSVPLEDASLRWLQFDWRKGRYFPFEVPAVGEKVEIAGPIPISLGRSVRRLINTLLAH